MGAKRRVCRLSDKNYRNIDLRRFEEEIINTINETVPNKNPRVNATSFSTDELTQSESIKLGRALAKLEDLVCYGKQVTIFRLFEGRLQEVHEIDSDDVNADETKKTKGGHMA